MAKSVNPRDKYRMVKVYDRKRKKTKLMSFAAAERIKKDTFPNNPKIRRYEISEVDEKVDIKAIIHEIENAETIEDVINLKSNAPEDKKVLEAAAERIEYIQELESEDAAGEGDCPSGNCD